MVSKGVVTIRIAAVGIVTYLLLGILVPLRGEGPLPPISDSAFWEMITGFSEEGGTFRYENLLSNETSYQRIIPALKRVVRGDAYIGVGPEQNFTYIAAIEPKISFIVDIRRQNMLELLMYKALFELSNDRVDFVSRLFSRQRPEGLNAGSTAEETFKSYSAEVCSPHLLDHNIRKVSDRLTVRHGFALTEDDRKTIEHVLETFCTAGPQIDYGFVNAPSTLTAPSYAQLMAATDGKGQNWGYLADEEAFDRIRKMQMNNLIVPLVGNFAGKKTIRAVGQYLKMRSLTVAAFYISNVEQYLNEDQKAAFRSNVATLPITHWSRVIRFTPPESTTMTPLSVFVPESGSLFHLLSSGSR
jgi:hypothetical protein